MGMSVGNKGGAMAEMNIVPLIDILLVLLIIFMAISPTISMGLSALVPQPAPPNQGNPGSGDATSYDRGAGIWRWQSENQ